MLREALSSKYIKTAVLFIAILTALVCIGSNSLGVSIQKEVSKDKIVDSHGEYVLVEKNRQCTVQTKDGEIVYTAIDRNPYFASKVGHIVDETSEEKKGVINFLTGETVYVPKGDDTIAMNKAGFWIIETTIKKSEISGVNAWYVLDENFEIALEGAMFTAIDGTEKYIYGQMLVNENYYNKEDLAKYETFGPGAEIKNCVIDKNGKIVYTSDEAIYSMDGDRIKVASEKTARYIYIDIFTGETEDAGYDSD